MDIDGCNFHDKIMNNEWSLSSAAVSAFKKYMLLNPQHPPLLRGLCNSKSLVVVSVFKPFSFFFLYVFGPRLFFNKRSLTGSHSSHSNLSQASVTSDILGGDEVDSQTGPQHAKVAERRSNGSTDNQGTRLYAELLVL